MRTSPIYIILIITVLLSCNTGNIKRPAVISPQDTLYAPDFKVRFATADENWEAVLYCPIQPILLESTFDDGILTVGMDNQGGLIEGPSEIILKSSEVYFAYPVFLKNTNQRNIYSLDYRSPKTLNPDFNLNQQRITHKYDFYRNLIAVKGGTYFLEQEIILDPKVNTYRAKQEDALTSFYVQAGSCTAIPLEASYKEESNSYLITAGPLFDAHNNVVADGTLVVFRYHTSDKSWHKEAFLKNGFVKVQIPVVSGTAFKLVAHVNNTISQTLNLSR